MTRRSPARFLAPLVLLVAIVTVYLVARPELETSNGTGSGTTSTATSAAKGTATTARKKTAKAKAKARAKTYTVKPGDVLGSISESTGVAVEDLLDFNDLEDAQSLRVGQKLKLAQ